MLACPLLTLENILYTIHGGPSNIFPGAQCGLLSQNCLEYSKYGIYEHSICIVGLSPLVHIQYENRHFYKRNGYFLCILDFNRQAAYLIHLIKGRFLSSLTQVETMVKYANESMQRKATFQREDKLWVTQF